MSKENAGEGEELKSGMDNSVNNESDSVQVQESTSAATKPSDSKWPSGDQEAIPSVVQRTGGPRTSAGKDRSKYNAIKHGIFSKVLLLNGEPRKEFDSLLNGLEGSLKPEGLLEKLLVEKLASLVWRYRRMLIVERGEIQRETIYTAWDEFVRKDPGAAFLKKSSDKKKQPGLIVEIENPLIMAKCVEQLQLLKRLIETRGLDCEIDIQILETIYGGDAFAVQKEHPVFLHYLVTTDSQDGHSRIPTWAQQKLVDGASEEELQAELTKLDKQANEALRVEFLKSLDAELEWFEKRAKVQAEVTAPKKKLEDLCRNVPELSRLDRLLRYEASLERSFDRTLSQLERLQRMRAGQPVPPELKVRVSG